MFLTKNGKNHGTTMVILEIFSCILPRHFFSAGRETELFVRSVIYDVGQIKRDNHILRLGIEIIFIEIGIENGVQLKNL